MFAAINAARELHGSPALAWDPAAAGVARNHSVVMAHTDTTQFHNPVAGPQLASAQPAARTWGENVGLSADRHLLWHAFWDSAGHRANLLSPTFTAGGVGCVQDEDGKSWVTHLFWS
mgnify:CR=1 FL=1